MDFLKTLLATGAVCIAGSAANSATFVNIYESDGAPPRQLAAVALQWKKHSAKGVVPSMSYIKPRYHQPMPTWRKDISLLDRVGSDHGTHAISVLKTSEPAATGTQVSSTIIHHSSS